MASNLAELIDMFYTGRLPLSSTDGRPEIAVCMGRSMTLNSDASSLLRSVLYDLAQLGLPLFQDLNFAEESTQQWREEVADCVARTRASVLSSLMEPDVAGSAPVVAALEGRCLGETVVWTDQMPLVCASHWCASDEQRPRGNVEWVDSHDDWSLLLSLAEVCFVETILTLPDAAWG